MNGAPGSTPVTRFLAIGDLHLGAHVQYADDRLGEQEAVWARALEVAFEESCDAVLFAGDAFDGPQVTPEQMDAFIRPIEATRGLMPVIAISGNGRHDSAMRRVNALAPLRHVPGLTVHSTPATEHVNGIAVCCMPWASTKHLRAMGEELGLEEVDHVNAYAARAALAVARGLHVDTDRPSILLTHFSISGTALPAGLPVDDLREPVLDNYALQDLGFDAVVAGHIHKPQALFVGHNEFAPTAGFYTGSPLPLNFGEANVDHGVWILDIDAAGAYQRFVPIDSRPFLTLELDIAGDDLSDGESDIGALLAQVNDVDGAIVKVRYTANPEQARQIDDAAIREALLDAGAHRVYIERTTIREQLARIEGLDDTVSSEDAVDLWIRANDIETELATLLRDRHDVYTRELEGTPA